jgi:hypothetical protein
MNDHLRRLGIRSEVELYFRGTYSFDKEGCLIFSYGDNREVFGIGFHLIPVSKSIWRAGQENPALIRKIFICQSAMDAICFLHLNYPAFPEPGRLCFIAIGLVPRESHFELLRGLSKGKNLSLIMGSGLYSHIADLKLASGIKGYQCVIEYVKSNTVRVTYMNKVYEFPELKFSLNAFEIVSGLRSGMRTYKSKNAESYLSQILQNCKQ